MKIGFTGTRKGMSQDQKINLVREILFHEATEFHHGDCIGADSDAHDVVQGFKIPIVIHPPTNDSKRAFKSFVHNPTTRELPPKDYLDRNQDIVDTTDILLAATETKVEKLRSGTWATVRYARKQGKPVIIL